MPNSVNPKRHTTPHRLTPSFSAGVCGDSSDLGNGWMPLDGQRRCHPGRSAPQDRRWSLTGGAVGARCGWVPAGAPATASRVPEIRSWPTARRRVLGSSRWPNRRFPRSSRPYEREENAASGASSRQIRGQPGHSPPPWGWRHSAFERATLSCRRLRVQ